MRPVTRSYVERVYELIDLLDTMDGDADFEEPDFAPSGEAQAAKGHGRVGREADRQLQLLRGGGRGTGDAVAEA